MSMVSLSLHELLDVALGSTGAGRVNFSALHAALRAMLDHLDLQHVRTTWTHPDDEDHPSPPHHLHHHKSTVGELSSRPSSPRHTEENPPRTEQQAVVEKQRTMEEKLRRIEQQMSMWEKLPSGAELLEQTSSTSPSRTPVQDMWTLMQLRHRTQTNEDGVSKSMGLIQDLLKEIQDLKAFRNSLKREVEQLKGQVDEINMGEVVTEVENCFHRVDELEAVTRTLRERVPEELDHYVSWDVLHSALLCHHHTLQQELGGSGTVETVRDTRVSGDPCSPVRTLTSPLAPGSTTIVPEAPLTSPRHSSPHHELLLPPRLPTVRAARPDADTAVGGSSSGGGALQRHPEAVEALREVGRLPQRHGSMEARLTALELGKVDQAQVAHLRELINNMGARELPDNLQDQLNHLRALVHSLTADRERSTESLNAVHRSIHQLQVECDKLHVTTTSLVEEHSLKQSHIQQLYKSMEELGERKADKQQVEMEVEMKAVLDSKVSQVQFDTETEQLNTMFHELLSKVTDQEHDWHTVIDRLSSEMEHKLNRIELDSVKAELEGRWRSILKSLQAQPTPQHQDAAGIRRQLVARFHCISCDRPIHMHVPGPHLVSIPSAPGLPSHKSSRPFSVYEVEHVHHQQLTSERIPEMSDYRYLAVSRSCGGSHTLTHPQQRYATRLQHITHVLQASHQVEAPQPPPPPSSQPAEADTQPMSPSQLREEVAILGMDGHIYKGRLNTGAVATTDGRLPTISPRDGIKSKDKLTRPNSQKSLGFPEPPGRSGTPVRAHSARSQRRRPGSSASGGDGSLSVLGSLSQGSLSQRTPPPSQTALETGTNSPSPHSSAVP